MRDLAELLAIIVFVILAVLACLFIVSLPIALIGWGVSAIVGLFTVVNISYWGYVGVGIGTAVVINLIRAFR